MTCPTCGRRFSVPPQPPPKVSGPAAPATQLQPPPIQTEAAQASSEDLASTDTQSSGSPPVVTQTSATDKPDRSLRLLSTLPKTLGAVGGTITSTGYRADRDKVATVRWLGATLLVVTLVGAIPTFFPPTRSIWPMWAQIVLFLTALQAVYVFWMVSIPDWSTIWVLMIVYAGLATVYGFVLAIAMVTPAGQPMLFQLDAVRDRASMWCGAMLMLTFLSAFVCGRCSYRWHKTYMLAAAGRNR